MDKRRADFSQPVLFAVLKMYRMAVKPAGAQQADPLVCVEIIPGFREQLFHPGDFVGLFRQMRLHQAFGMLGPERAHRLELFAASMWVKTAA